MSTEKVRIAARATTRMIDSIPAGAADRIIADEVVSNLYLFVTPRGGKSWRWIGRLKTGEARKLSLGKWPAHTLAAARDWGRELNEARERGDDPRAIKAAEKEIAGAALKNTISGALDGWFEDKRRNNEATRSLHEYRGIWDRYMPVEWQKKPVAKLTLRDVKAALDGLKDRDIIVQANRWLRLIKQFLDWCEVQEMVARNVARPLKPATENGQGSRELSIPELALAYRAAANLSADERDIVRLMIYTGCRRMEAIGAASDEFREGLWTLPIAREDGTPRSKSHRPHPMTLGAEAQSIFARKKDRELLFTEEGVAQKWFYKYLSDQLIREMEKLSGETIERFTVHGIRKGVGTAINSDEMDALMGDKDAFTAETVEIILNHSVPKLQKTYNKARYQRLIGRALAAWERLLMQEVAKQSGENVVQLRAAG